MRRFFLIALTIAALGLSGSGASAFAQGAPDQALLAMLALDRRVATIGHRLAVANLDLCAARAWLPGFAVHDLSQYGADFRPAATRAFAR